MICVISGLTFNTESLALMCDLLINVFLQKRKGIYFCFPTGILIRLCLRKIPNTLHIKLFAPTYFVLVVNFIICRSYNLGALRLYLHEFYLSNSLYSSPLLNSCCFFILYIQFLFFCVCIKFS